MHVRVNLNYIYTYCTTKPIVCQVFEPFLKTLAISSKMLYNEKYELR